MTTQLYAHPRYPLHYLAVDADGTVTLRAANATGTPVSKGPGYRLLVSHAKRVPAWIERLTLRTWEKKAS